MNSLQKNYYKSAFKYTWPLYIITALLVGFGLYFLFGVTHRTPDYKTLTLFVSGEITDRDTLKSDLFTEFQDKELKSVSLVESKIDDNNYHTKLSVVGYNSADILIIPSSKLDDLVVSTFGLELKEEIVNDYYQGSEFYSQNSLNYGIKIDKEKVSKYMTLPDEECYMILNGKSANIGKYSSSQNDDHNMALLLAKDWSKHA